MDKIYFHLEFLLIGYGLSTVLFITLSVAIKFLKRLRPHYLNLSNCGGLILCLCLSTVAIFNFNSYAQNLAEDEIMSAHYKTVFTIAIICSAIVPLFFLFPKIRKNPIATLIILLIIFWNHWTPFATLFLSYFYMDYLPSSWSVSYQDEATERKLYAALNMLLFFIGCLILASKQAKRQPSGYTSS